MENNEDNRQMTVIAAEIERQKTILKGIQENHDSLSGDIAANKVKHTIEVLQSMLPKEEKALKDMVESGIQYAWDHTQFLPQDAAEKIFNETFKTHEHGKQTYANRENRKLGRQPVLLGFF